MRVSHRARRRGALSALAALVLSACSSRDVRVVTPWFREVTTHSSSSCSALFPMAESGGGIGETVSERYVGGRFVELEIGASDCVSIAEGESVLCHTYSDHHAYPPGPALSGILQKNGRWIPLDCGRRVFLADGTEVRNAFVPGATSKGEGREIRCVEGSGEEAVTKLRREPTRRR